MTFLTPSSEPLSEAELEFLNETLLKYGNDDSVLDVSELDGFLTAIVSGPNMIPPSQWFSALWGGEGCEPDWEDEAEIQRFMQLVMQHMNEIADTLITQSAAFKALFNQREVDGEKYLIVDEWCEGYMRGVALDEDAWATAPQALLKDTLAVISMFAGEYDDHLARLNASSIKALQDKIEPAVRHLHAYWLQRRTSAEAPTAKPLRQAPKVGRNDPCPCGSGKKFKRCCLN